ncbi:MAG: hypothetical protein KAQ82_00235 [Dehalococcoidia bacterium]|nr:hypothetical protein [Dehalococcoidia bacterium]
MNCLPKAEKKNWGTGIPGIQNYARRTKAAELAFGDADFYHGIVAREMGL